MWRNWSRRRRAVVSTALVLAVAGPVSAAVIYSVSGVVPVAVPGPFGAYTMPLTIDPAFGDSIRGIETGRDDKSPYCAFVVSIGALNPALPQLNSYLGGWPPPGAVVPPYSGGSGFTMRLVYRSINDPANPGWAGLPGGNCQLDEAWQTVAALAAELTAYRNFVILGGPSTAPPTPVLTVSPQIYVEFDPVGPGTLFEFYKIKIMR